MEPVLIFGRQFSVEFLITIGVQIVALIVLLTRMQVIQSIHGKRIATLESKLLNGSFSEKFISRGEFESKRTADAKLIDEKLGHLDEAVARIEGS